MVVHKLGLYAPRGVVVEGYAETVAGFSPPCFRVWIVPLPGDQYLREKKGIATNVSELER